VLTERECRRLEAAGDGERYSVEILGGQQRDRRRWPDVVVDADGHRRAIEIEFAPKGTPRLKAIVAAYERARPYSEAVFMVKSAAIGRRIQQLTGNRSPLQEMLNLPTNEVHVVPWPRLPAEERARLRAALDR
jgi:hypothetical protein